MTAPACHWCAVCMDRPRSYVTNHIPHCNRPACMAYVRRLITGTLETA